MALLVGMALLFTAHPAMIRYLGAGLVVFVVAGFALILAAYAFVFLAPRRAKRAGFTLSDSSFVGYDEGNTRLRVIEEGNAACRVEMTLGYYAIAFDRSRGWRPRAACGAAYQRADRVHWANPMIAFALLFSIGLSALLIKMVLRFPVSSAVDARGAKPRSSFAAAKGWSVDSFAKDIEGLSVDEHLFLNSHGDEDRSAILVAHLIDGTTKRLVASYRQQDVDAIAQRMRFLLGLH